MNEEFLTAKFNEEEQQEGGKIKMKNLIRQMKGNNQFNKPILHKFNNIKEYIGVVSDQEVIRFCITYTFRGLYNKIIQEISTFEKNQNILKQKLSEAREE